MLESESVRTESGALAGCCGAGDGIRTRDIQLGRLSLYQLSYSRDAVLAGRGGWIRTNDPLLPKQVRYQTALRPDAVSAKATEVYRNGALQTRCSELLMDCDL